MNEQVNQAQKEIRLIKEMIDRTKRNSVCNWLYLILWGLMAILAIIGMHLLVILEKYSLIWLNWVIFMGIGALWSAFLGIRQQRREKTRTYIGDALSGVGIISGLAFFATGFAFPLMDLYPAGTIPVMIAIIAGVSSFSMGAILEWGYLKWCGILWLAGALGMGFVHWHYRTLLFIPLLIAGYIVPGFIMQKKYRNGRAKDE